MCHVTHVVLLRSIAIQPLLCFLMLFAYRPVVEKEYRLFSKCFVHLLAYSVHLPVLQ